MRSVIEKSALRYRDGRALDHPGLRESGRGTSDLSQYVRSPDRVLSQLEMGDQVVAEPDLRGDIVGEARVTEHALDDLADVARQVIGRVLLPQRRELRESSDFF